MDDWRLIGLIHTVLTYLGIVPFILNIIFSVIIVFYERKNPTATWVWFMVLLLVPYIGFLLYIMLGMDSRKHRVFASKQQNDIRLYEEYLSISTMRNRFANIDNKNSALEPKFENLNDMVYLNFISGRGNLSSDNDVHILNNGHKKFESLISDIKLAKKFIHMEYYILQNDYLGRRILDELSKKASEGVKVRLYVDGMGSYLTSKRFYKNLISKGGEVCIFYPTNFIRINFRNHRKIAVIDGYKAYIGGMNIGDEYLGLSKKFGLWRDMHIKIMGTAAAELNLRFIMDWNFSSSKK